MKRLAHSPELNGPVIVEVPAINEPVQEKDRLDAAFILGIFAGIAIAATVLVMHSCEDEPGPVNIPHKSTTGSEG